MCGVFHTKPSLCNASWVSHNLTQFCHYLPRESVPLEIPQVSLSPTRLSMSPFRRQTPAQIITCASDQPAIDQGANDSSPWVPPRPQGNISLHLPVYERTQVNSLVKKGPVQSGRVLRAGGSAGMESGHITLPVWMCLPTGSSPNPTEASLYRHDQTFNSIFRCSPFSRRGRSLLKISSFKSWLGLPGDQSSSKNHSGAHPGLPC